MAFDAQFWTAVSFFILVALIYRPLKALILNGLDNRAVTIQKELNEAHRLREEAEMLLIASQRKHKEVVEEAAEIIRHAEETSQHMAKEAQAALAAAIAKRVEIANQKIANYELAAIQEIQQNTVKTSIEAVRSLMQDNMDEAASAKLIQDSIAGISKKLH
jgi:F-type H+-transporting ATPase subunit b